MAERIFSLPTHAINQAINPKITPKTIRSIDFSFYFFEMSSPEHHPALPRLPASRL
jgi:hypothetical protein